MATDRMLNCRIGLNKAVNDLAAESAFVFTWGIAHLDRDVRIHGWNKHEKITYFYL